MQIEHYGKSNSSSGNWYIKLTNQTYEFFWRKSEMLTRLEELGDNLQVGKDGQVYKLNVS